MARLSFTLRKGDTGGSAVQEVSAGQVNVGDHDLALRADDFIYAVQPLGDDSWFDVSSVDYATMRLSWEIGVELDVAVQGQTLTALRIVYSDEGTPRSVSDGQTILVLTKDHWHEEYIHVVSDFAYTLAPFAYYSMFGRYTDGASVWYERVASVDELVVSDHGSAVQLWQRIPLHYRLLDDEVAVAQDTLEGPLQQFLGVFGFEVDRHRSLIQQLWRINDPDFTHEQSLSALAQQVGLMVDLGDIPAKFLRNILANYGFLRESKGTLTGVMAYLNALTECHVTALRRNEVIDGANSQIYLFMLGAQRANLIPMPRFQYGQDGGLTPEWVAYEDDLDTSQLTWDPVTKTLTNNSGLETRVHIQPLDSVLIKNGVPYYSSVVVLADGRPIPSSYAPELSFSAVDPSVQTAVAIDGLTVSAPLIDTQSGEVRFSVSTEAGDPVEGYVVLSLTMPVGGSVVLDRWVLQPYRDGPYFDGDSELGGFINDNLGNIAKDYRWTGNRGQSASVYTEYVAHKRSAVLKSMDFMMPGLFAFDDDPANANGFEFLFNALPGQAELEVLEGTWDAIAGTWPPRELGDITLVSAPGVDGQPLVDYPFAATDVVWSDGETAFTDYRWFVEETLIPGVEGREITPDVSMKGKRLRIEVRREGTFTWFSSAWTEPVMTQGHIYPLTYPRTYNL